MTKKILTFIIIALIAFLALPQKADPAFRESAFKEEKSGFAHIFSLLRGAKEGDLLFCLGYIKNSSFASGQVANFIQSWNPKEHERKIPVKFRSKITRIANMLKAVDYQQLIIDIDIIKNSHLTVKEMVGLIKGTGLAKSTER